MGRSLWRAFGVAALGCGAAGVVLPLVPTTPFLLLAAWAFARSSPRLEAWLLNHPHFGRPILDWRRERAIAPKAKAAAVAAMAATLGASALAGLDGWVLGLQAAALGLVALYVLSRPDVGPRRRS